jgi:hypothetical protein
MNVIFYPRLEQLRKKIQTVQQRNSYTLGVALLEKLKLSGNNENNFIHD